MSFIRRDLAELTKQLQGIEPSPKHKEFIASTPSKPRRRNHTNGGTHKQNLRASKRNGKQYKVRKKA